MLYTKKKSDNQRVARKILDSNAAITCQDELVLAEIIDTDIRENLPPQMLAVVNAVIKVIEDLEEN